MKLHLAGYLYYDIHLVLKLLIIDLIGFYTLFVNRLVAEFRIENDCDGYVKNGLVNTEPVKLQQVLPTFLAEVS